MAAKRTPAVKRKLDELLSRDHTLYGAILFGLDGEKNGDWLRVDPRIPTVADCREVPVPLFRSVVEMQARAMDVLRDKVPLAATKISGVAREGVRESLDRIAGALA